MMYRAVPVTTVQRILQTLYALLVEPLPAAATLQHPHVPLSVLPAIAVPLFRVAAVTLVPRQLIRLQQQAAMTYMTLRYTSYIRSTAFVTYVIR
jgi:hypothetical protein